MNRLTDNLDSIADRIRESFSTKDAAREKVLPLCRESIRCCSKAIRAVHRQEFDQAEALLQSAHDLLVKIDQAINAANELKQTGFVRDAQKEFAEGSITLALVTGDLSRGEELLSAMDDIYNILVTMDFPDAITGGLRRTTDMVRGVLERTRSDLTLAIRQKDVEDRLGRLDIKED